MRITHRAPATCGDPRALELLGATPDAAIRLTALTADRGTVPIGQTVTFTLTVELAGTKPGEAVIDYRVHYVGANGVRRPRCSSSRGAGWCPVSRPR